MSDRSVSNVSSAEVGRIPNNHHPPGNSVLPRAARSWRRRRLRVVAGPTARLIENATRGGVACASSNTVHHSVVARIRDPSRSRRANACRPRIRQIKPTGGRGPWRGGPSGSHGPTASSSGRESRACGHGGDCLAGTYASHRPPVVLDITSNMSTTWTGPRRGTHPDGCRLAKATAWRVPVTTVTTTHRIDATGIGRSRCGWPRGRALTRPPAIRHGPRGGRDDSIRGGCPCSERMSNRPLSTESRWW
jgi:hypothetical protein